MVRESEDEGGRPQSESWFAGGIGNNQCKQKDGHGDTGVKNS